MKLWGGRFQKTTDPIFEKFGKSLDSDQRLVYHDLRACSAHITMLSEQGVLDEETSTPLLRPCKICYQNLSRVEKSMEMTRTSTPGSSVD